MSYSSKAWLEQREWEAFSGEREPLTRGHRPRKMTEREKRASEVVIPDPVREEEYRKSLTKKSDVR